MAIDKWISPYIASQFPRLYREEGPAFIQFVKMYYEWMEQSGNTLGEAKRLPEYRDIDTTLEDFLSHFKNKYMSGLPEDALGDKRTLQKHIKEIYSSKGTAQGLELLFRLLYNETSEIYLPGDDILRPSDGVWVQPVYLEVSVNPYNVLLIGETITGRESQATAIVEDFQTRYINKRQINLLFLSNVRGDFKTNEIILSNVIEDPLQSPTVIGSMVDVLVNESGFGFKVGDVLEISEGSGMLGKAVVSSVSPRNGAVSFTIQNGGSGYANNNAFAPNIITVEPVDNDNPGIGAAFEIGKLSNTEVITTAVDVIAAYANTQLNSPDYQMPTNVGVENINTPLNQALNIQNITVGTIESLRAVNPGEGYNGPVIVTVESPVIAGLMIEDPVNGNYKGNNAVVVGKAAAGNGAIDTVKILNSGIGYANGDHITMINANVEFIAGGFVVLGKQGKSEGYWKDTRSFLNSDKYIQDSFYYQEYSYETRLSVAFSYYSDLLKKLWHPAGTQGFGKVVVSTVVDSFSEAVEVDIVATRITEYATMFATYLVTTGATSTTFVTRYGTEYVTEVPTETSRTTSEDYLINIPNLVINGAFNINTDNWVARGDSDVSWANGAMHILRVTEGSAQQSVATTDGNSFQLDVTYAGATANVTVYACKTDNTAVGEVLVSETRTGAANTFRLEFVGVGSNTFIILEVDGEADFDNVQLRDVPTITQQTNYVTNFVRDTALNAGSRITAFNTISAFNTTFNTAYDTAYDSFAQRTTSFLTQAITSSTSLTSIATTRQTATMFGTTFVTNFATARLTDTSRNTAFVTDRVTASVYDTLFGTTFATNRATTTAFNTTYLSDFATNRATTTSYDTTFATTDATNRATTTTFFTNRATTTLFDTERATSTVRATNRATTTAYETTLSTNRATNTTTTTAFNTTFVTAYVSSYVTDFSTSYTTAYNTTFATTYNTIITFDTSSGGGAAWETQDVVLTTRQTSRATSRATAKETTRATSIATSKSTVRATSKSTAIATTTVFVTDFATNRATTTAFNTTFGTLSTFATNFATTTTFATNLATTTTFNTTGSTSFATSKSTTTAFETSISTVKATNQITTTAFDTTEQTSFATSRATATAYDTVIATVFGTSTAYDTLFETTGQTSLSTSTAYLSQYLTAVSKLTDVETSALTNTLVGTPVSRATNRTTLRATDRATSTSRTTNLLTNISTAVQRATNTVTEFIAYPTSFVTGYLTGTAAPTTYLTEAVTNLETGTVYDTEYPTERLTAVLTQTDVADE